MNEEKEFADVAQLRDFLLQRLPDDQAEVLEQRLLCDADVLPALQLAEIDLIDSYAAGRLDTRTRAAVERHLLVTPEARQRLAFSRALQASRRGVRRRLRPRRAFATLLAAGFAALAVLLWPRPASRNTGASQLATSTYTIALLGDLARGVAEPPNFAVPSGTTQVQLQLEVPAPAVVGADYQISVTTDEGQLVLAATGLSAGQAGPYHYVETSLPVAQFGRGLRYIRLSNAAGTPLADWTILSR